MQPTNEKTPSFTRMIVIDSLNPIGPWICGWAVCALVALWERLRVQHYLNFSLSLTLCLQYRSMASSYFCSLHHLRSLQNQVIPHEATKRKISHFQQVWVKAGQLCKVTLKKGDPGEGLGGCFRAHICGGVDSHSEPYSWYWLFLSQWGL